MDTQELSSKKEIKGFVYYRTACNSAKIHNSISIQQKICREVANQRGLIIVEEFQEIDSAHRNRSIFNGMMNRLDEVNFVIAWSLDRLIRKTEDIIWFFSRLKETNTEFINASHNYIEDADSVRISRFYDIWKI